MHRRSRYIAPNVQLVGIVPATASRSSSWPVLGSNFEIPLLVTANTFCWPETRNPEEMVAPSLTTIGTSSSSVMTSPLSFVR